MPDHLLNCWIMSKRQIMSTTELVIRVPSSAYHLLASVRSLEAVS